MITSETEELIKKFRKKTIAILELMDNMADAFGDDRETEILAIMAGLMDVYKETKKKYDK